MNIGSGLAGRERSVAQTGKRQEANYSSVPRVPAAEQAGQAGEREGKRPVNFS